MERFDIFAQKNGVGEAPDDAAPTSKATNGHSANDTSNPAAAPASPSSSTSQKRHADSEDLSENGTKTPPKKKRKADNIDADALYAAKLQAEENMRARPTRAGSARKAAPIKKKKSKTSKKVKAEDDSDVESGSETGAKKEVNRSGGFHVSYITIDRSLLLFAEQTLS
jgi:upstream activation factor subunit UAF30